MPTTIDEFVKYLQAEGVEVELIEHEKLPNMIVVRLKDFEIDVGTLSGEHAEILIRLQKDFPVTGPTGFDTRPALRKITNGGNNPIATSPIGDGWAYWSRPFAEWPRSERDPQAVMGWLRRAFANAPDT